MRACVCVCVCLRKELVWFVSWACGVARRQLCMQHDSPVPLDAVAAQGNNVGSRGAKVLRIVLGKLTKITELWLDGTCG